MASLTTPTGTYRELKSEAVSSAIDPVIHVGKRARSPPDYAIPDLEESHATIQLRLAKGGSFIPLSYVSPRTNLVQGSPETRFPRSILTHPDDASLFGHRVTGTFEGESTEIEVTLWVGVQNILALFTQVKGAKLVIVPASSWVQRGRGTTHGYGGLYLHALAVPARHLANLSTDTDVLSELPDDQRKSIIAAAQEQAKADAEKGILSAPAVQSTLADLRASLIAAIDATLTPSTAPETTSDQDVFDLDDFDDEEAGE